MPKKIVRVPMDLFNALTKFISEDSISGFTEAALMEWLSWLDGSWRPMSISEIEAERIFKIYSNVLVEHIPSSDHIGEFFDLPLGRARYIMQVLNYRHGAFIRERQTSHIIKALEGGEISDNGETYTVRVDKSVKKTLDQMIRGLVAEGHLRSAVSGRETLEHVRYEMGKGHRDTLLEAFQADLADREA